MSAAIVRMTVLSVCLDLVSGISFDFETSLAAQVEEERPGHRHPAMRVEQASAPKQSDHNSSQVDEVNESTRDTNESTRDTNESTRDTGSYKTSLAAIAHRRQQVLQLSINAQLRLAEAVAERQAAAQAKADAENEQAMVSKELRKGEEKLRAAKERRLNLTTQDLQMDPLSPAYKHSKSLLAKAQALVATAEEQIAEVNTRVRAAEKKGMRTSQRLATVQKVHFGRSTQAALAYRDVTSLGDAIRNAQEQHAQVDAAAARARLDVQGMITALNDALDRGARADRDEHFTSTNASTKSTSQP